MREWKRQIEGRTLSNEEKVAMLTGARGGRVKGLGVGDSLRMAIFEEHDTAVDAFIQIPELRTESQYSQEITPLSGTHNRTPTDQRKPGHSVPL